MRTQSEELCDLLAQVHSASKVGGVFNAYEKAVQYLITTALYEKGRWDVQQEFPRSNGSGPCDLVIGSTPGHLWLEVKMWWFCYGQLGYWTKRKPATWPLGDWKNLAHRPDGDHRAVLLVRCWDRDGEEDAKRWVKELQSMLTVAGAPKTSRLKQLQDFVFPKSSLWPDYAVHGDVHVWSSADV